VVIHTCLNPAGGFGTKKTKVPIAQALFDTVEGADRPGLPFWG